MCARPGWRRRPGLLETTDLTMAVIAQRTGFGRAESLRQAFTGRYGIAPSRFRKGR